MSQLCSLAVGMLLDSYPCSRDYYQMVNRPGTQASHLRTK